MWLVFSITILFSAFPAAFSALGTELRVPLTIALLGIVLRSAALGLRASPGTTARARAMLSRMFGAASLIAPFMFGAVAGGLAAVSSSPPPGAPCPLDRGLRAGDRRLGRSPLGTARRELRGAGHGPLRRATAR